MRTIGRTYVALASSILALSGVEGLRAQATAKPVNVDAKVLHNAGSVVNDALSGSWLSLG